MKKHTYLSKIWRFFKTAIVTDLSLFIVIGLVCWLLGWRTAHQYGHGLEFIGLLAILLVLLSIPGSYQEWSLAYQIVEPMGVKEVYRLVQQKSRDNHQNLGFLLLVSVTGFVATGLGVMIQNFFIG